MELDKYTEIACKELGISTEKLNDEGFLNSEYWQYEEEVELPFEVNGLAEYLKERNWDLLTSPATLEQLDDKVCVVLTVMETVNVSYRTEIERMVDNLKKI